MNIAIFMCFFSPEKNGVINYVIGLYNDVKKLKPDIKISIITFDSRHLNVLKTEEGIFSIYRLPCYILLGGTYAIPTFHGIKEFWKIVKTERFDAVNTHTRFFVSSLLGLILAKKQRIPLLHTEHGSSFVKDGSWFTRFVARAYDETIGRLVISSASKIFGVSKSCVEFAHKLGGKNGITIYNGIDSDFWETAERMPNPIPKITFCGRMVKGKGVQDLIQVLANLKHLQWELHLVGDGNYLTELQKLATEFDLHKRITWHGNQHREYLKSVLGTTDIFINPSYTEGLPTSVLEAGAMRCAVIATDVGGTSEIITNGENGILLPKPNRENKVISLQQALESLIRNHELQREYGIKISNLVIDKFSWDNISNQFLIELKSIDSRYF